MVNLESNNDLTLFNQIEKDIMKNKLKELSLLTEYVYYIRKYLKNKHGGGSLRCVMYIANKIDDFLKKSDSAEDYEHVESHLMIDYFRSQYYSKYIKKNANYNPKFGLSKSL